ncbi:hypothetical protein BC939DRAFT_502514 [Gamsiella multidivaricata]|uniref:uncharacterized protein n=1 Tax=Gamsiella multidivaricata TaxID=101098 RepID=UPI0022200FEA|nr:uncharacterized protein BC939DRAFT_502514 [Gamsiella multidivaricata]KAI7824795.1 hypothetical protein BC939DRAFT_502514 [Gamsiella multidivaricata]
MAKRKTTTKKTRQAAHPSSKHASTSPSVVSSPSPQPQDLIQRRRKGTPVRSPSQGDPSKGIVFAFRIQNDSDLSMAVDILSYDQVQEEDNSVSSSSSSNSTGNTGQVPVTAAVAATATETSTGATTIAVATEPCEHKGHSSPAAAASTPLMPTQLKVAGEQWSSDPSSYMSSNVVDLSRNVLILHSRKPQESSVSSPSSPLFHPYRRPSAPSRSSSMSQPSTPSLSDSGSLSSSASSASSSPSSTPGSPTLCHSPPGGGVSEKEDLCSLESLSSPISPLDLMRSQPSRMLSVRGLGAGGRRMQVYLV